MTPAGHHDSTRAAWRTSTHSNNGGNCVEAAGHDGVVAVRDTTQHGTGPVLRFPAQAWRGFTGQIKQP
jgi:hypothetical protein